MKKKKKEVPQNLEIEKRYLLKNIPSVGKFDECYHITQYYTPAGRFRYILGINGEKFIKTVKKTISSGVNQEDEWELTEKDFKKAIKKCTKRLSKTRLIKNVGKRKWEVDVFNLLKGNKDLIIAEIELDTVKELNTVKVPKFIKDVLVLDITGVKAFSNFNLADKFKIK